MKSLLLITTSENKKIVARYIHKGDRWGVDGEYIWRDDVEDYQEHLHDGIEFYLCNSCNEHQSFCSYLGEWITRFDKEDFEYWLAHDDKILCGNSDTEIELSNKNIRDIQKWINNMI